MNSENSPTRDDILRYGQNYLVEMEGIALYRMMAAAEEDAKRAEIFEKLAGNEERHAQRWARLIQAAGGSIPTYRPGLRVRALGWIARKFGTRRVLPIISSMEARDEAGYMEQPEAAGLPAEERAHSRTLWAMSGGSQERHPSLAPSAGMLPLAAEVYALRSSVSTTGWSPTSVW